MPPCGKNHGIGPLKAVCICIYAAPDGIKCNKISFWPQLLHVTVRTIGAIMQKKTTEDLYWHTTTHGLQLHTGDMQTCVTMKWNLPPNHHVLVPSWWEARREMLDILLTGMKWEKCQRWALAMQLRSSRMEKLSKNLLQCSIINLYTAEICLRTNLLEQNTMKSSNGKCRPQTTRWN